MTYHVGITSDRIRITAVTLKDGQFYSKFERDLAGTLSGRDQYNRNRHLQWLIEHFLDYLDLLPAEEKAQPSGAILREAVVRLSIESASYDMSRRELVEASQVVGSILSLPYTVHEVSQVSWRNSLIGKGGVTTDEVRESIYPRFDLRGEFGPEDKNWLDAFCVARFGYLKDQPDS